MEVEVGKEILHFNSMKEYLDLREETRRQVSDEHPIKCVCGRLCTGLHEMQCSKFKKSVDRRLIKLKKREALHC